MPDYKKKKLLILGGTSQGKALAMAVAVKEIDSIYSLAGRTVPEDLPPLEVRTGGFGGISALVEYLIHNHITAVVDATHAYANQISKNVNMACRRLNLPLLRLEEEPWEKEEGNNWIEVPDLPAAREQAASLVSQNTARVFVTTGRQTVPEFSSDPRCWWLIRVIPSPVALPGLIQGQYIYDRGPFDAAQEVKLMEHHKIDAVISKNAGSRATYAKIVAAQQLSLPVIMIRRPVPVDGTVVHSVDEVLVWLD